MQGGSEFQIELLDVKRRRREVFNCGVDALTSFLRQRARKEMQSHTSACFVAVPITDPGRIAGYYTLSAATILTTVLPPELVARLPRYPNLPATLLGRLARDVSFRGQGIGELLLISALRRALGNTVVVGSVAVVTDPKDAQAAAFYSRYGFRKLISFGERLFLPMQEITKALGRGD